MENKNNNNENFSKQRIGKKREKTATKTKNLQQIAVQANKNDQRNKETCRQNKQPNNKHMYTGKPTHVPQ